MKTQIATKPCHLAEDLLSKFDNIQDGWVVLVGDGKIYKHLMNIKKQYNTALQNLLLFPGDWHILKNFQPILMKVYYAAGLREMAKNSGYHGSTLSLWSSVLILNEHTIFCCKHGKPFTARCFTLTSIVPATLLLLMPAVFYCLVSNKRNHHNML